jgi:hypothetical protein
MLQESDALAIQQAVLDYFTAEVLAEHPEWVEVRRLAEPPLTDHLIGRYGVWVVRAGADSDLRLSARTTDRNRHVGVVRQAANMTRSDATDWRVELRLDVYWSLLGLACMACSSRGAVDKREIAGPAPAASAAPATVVAVPVPSSKRAASPIVRLAFSGDSRSVVALARDGSLSRLDVASGTVKTLAAVPDARDVAVSPDGASIAIVAQTGLLVEDSRAARVAVPLRRGTRRCA